MCTFVTALLPRSADLARIRSAVGPATEVLRPIVNPSVERYVGADGAYYRAYEGMCDCGVALGRAAHDTSSGKPPEVQVRALRRKGWSEAKVQRWLEEKSDAAARKAAERQARADHDLARWYRLLAATVGSGASPWVALLIHEYNGGLETDDIDIRRREEVPLSRVDDDTLQNMQQDVLYVFTTGRTRGV